MQYTPQRLERVYRAMKRDEIDSLVVTRRQDVQYLTGFESTGHNVPIGCIIAEGSHPHLILSDNLQGNTAVDSILGSIHTFNSDASEDWFRAHGNAFWDEALRVLNEMGQTKGMIGLQHDWLSVREFEKIKTNLPEAGFRDFSQALWKLRHIKDPVEIDAIRQAVRVAEIGVRTALEIVASGKSEDEASLEIEAAMRGAGGQQRGIRAAVLSGTHARFPVAQPGPDRIKTEDFVVLDITVSHSGYFAEIARTIHLGKPSERQRALHDSILHAIKAGEKVMKPDVSIEEVANHILKKSGRGVHPESFVQPLGSSIGLDLHEPPYISPKSQYSLREGMVFTLHPTRFLPEVGSAKVADVVLLTHDGMENLGSLARETM
ncbi:MAG: Xaa-Pro peptidase family protein [Candidatus Thorarchaeota archaeon]|nr:Xaa-Pro peptidase family protein [Candidatus Thorarchaeota archaeon]